MNQNEAGRPRVVVGLGFGDEGKGAIVDGLVRRIAQHVPPDRITVVRFNGGAQAGHNVVTPEGTHHCFSQFGSGTLAGARTHLSAYHLLDPVSLMNERDALAPKIGRDPFDLLTISPAATIVTPVHKLANRAEESLRGDEAHGSCGMGIGWAVRLRNEHARWIFAEGIHQIELNRERVREQADIAAELLAKEFGIAALARDEYGRALLTGEWPDEEWELSLRLLAGRAVADVFRGDETVIGVARNLVFEGAQGFLLDEIFGFYPPHVTWSRTDPTVAIDMLEQFADVPRADVEVIGVTRAFPTRHGAGPFPTESAALTTILSDPHNVTSRWQGPLRYGWPDFELLRYAINTTGCDTIALTRLDDLDTLSKHRISLSTFACVAYSTSPEMMKDFVSPITTGHRPDPITPVYDVLLPDGGLSLPDRKERFAERFASFPSDFPTGEGFEKLRITTHGPTSDAQTWAERGK